MNLQYLSAKTPKIIEKENGGRFTLAVETGTRYGAPLASPSHSLLMVASEQEVRRACPSQWLVWLATGGSLVRIPK